MPTPVTDSNKNSASPYANVNQPLSKDPVYYVMLIVFALLTTTLPAVLGQTRFLPIAQALALTAFLAFPLRASLWRRGLLVMVLWQATALISIVLLTLVIPDQIENALVNGFSLRTETIAWASGAAKWPGSPYSDPRAYLIDLTGVVLGSLATAGLVGNWFLMRIANATGFNIGILLRSVDGIAGQLLSIPFWSLLWISGLAGFVILFSQPILGGQWSVRYYWTHQRLLVLWSSLLVIVGTLTGIVFPGVWPSMLVNFLR